MKSQTLTWSRSIRVSSHRLEYCRKRALEEGWQLSDLARMLICLGATSYFLRLRNPEASERFRRLATMTKASASLDVALGRRRGRRNEPKHIGETTLLPIHLPRGFYDLMSKYSEEWLRETIRVDLHALVNDPDPEWDEDWIKRRFGLAPFLSESV